MEITSLNCPNCGASISDKIVRGKLFKCDNCGNALVWPERRASLVLYFGARLCPSCGADNEQTREFCRNCGTSLVKGCPKCKTLFYVGDNFCPNGHNYDYECQIEVENDHQQSIAWYLQRADDLGRTGQLVQAAEILEQALLIEPYWGVKIAGYPHKAKLDPSEPESGYGLLIHLAGKMSNRKLAIEFYQRMIELNPQMPEYAMQAAVGAGIEREAREMKRKR
jgi:tetratricopeptide (TPR) repeat protein